MGRRSERLSKQGMLASDLGRRGRRHSGGVARVRRAALLRGPRGAARQSGNIQSLRPAAIDGVAADPHADADGPAGLSAARPEISHRPERGGDEHLDDEGLAASQPDPAAAAGCRRAICRARSASSFPTASIWSISNSPARPMRSACTRAPAAASRWRARPRACLYRRARSRGRRCLLIRKWSARCRKRPNWLRSRIEANRRFLREHGYVVACGTWSPHINGCAVPLWSPQYQTFVVVTIGLLSAMYDEKRLHKEVAPRMLDLAAAVGGAAREREGDIFTNRLERKPLAGAGP